MTSFPEYARVQLTTDRFADEGAPRGALGYVLTDYGDGNYEVEVSNPTTGETIAEFVARRDELTLA